MNNQENTKPDLEVLKTRIESSSKGNPASYDAEASYLRKQQLLAKAKVTDYLIRYLNLVTGTNENLAKTLDELDKIEIAAKMAIDEARALHGDHLFTDAEVEHLMNQFKKHRPTDSNVYPDKPAVKIQHVQEEMREIIDPPLSSYDKLESSWLARKMSKWLFSRKEETTERVVREAKQAREQENIQTKQNKQTLMESYREERPGKLVFASGAGERDEVKKESAWQKAKNWGRKFATRFLFTAAALSSTPIKTADTNLPPINGKNIAIEKKINPTTKNQSVLKTHAEIIAENPNIAPTGSTKKSFTGNVKETGSTPIDSFDSSVLPTMKEVLEQRNIDSAEFIAKTNPDTILQTPVGQSVDTIVSKNTHVKDTIEKLTPSPLKQIEIKADTSKADTGTLKNFIQNLDKKEKGAPDQKIKKSPTTPSRVQDTPPQAGGEDWTAPKPTPTSELNHPTTAPEAVGLWSAGANPNKFDTPSVSGGIKVTYQDKNGNVLDTNRESKIPEIVYTPMPKKGETTPQKAIGDRQSGPSVSSNEETITTDREAVGAPVRVAPPVHDPIVTAPASAIDTEFYNNRIPLEQMERGESMPVPEGWSSKPIDTARTIEPGGHFKGSWNIHEYRVRDIDGYIDVPYFLWKKMDPVIWDALKGTPGALKKYIELSEREGRQDPYVIRLWDGNTATEYIVNEYGRIATEPRERKADNPSFGQFTASIKKTDGQTITVSGENYGSLNEIEKQILDMTVTQTGKENFTIYSFHANGVGEGSEVFKGNQLVIEETEQVKKEIQKELIRARNEMTIPLHRVQKNVLQDGKTVIKVQWMPDEIKDPTYKERKVEVKHKKGVLKKKTTTVRAKNRLVKKAKGVVYDYSEQQ